MLYSGAMGESMHAYQSPSKDLSHINARIAAHSASPSVPAAAHPDPTVAEVLCCQTVTATAVLYVLCRPPPSLRCM